MFFFLDYLSVFYQEQNQTSMDLVLEQETNNLVTNIGLRWGEIMGQVQNMTWKYYWNPFLDAYWRKQS